MDFSPTNSKKDPTPTPLKVMLSGALPYTALSNFKKKVSHTSTRVNKKISALQKLKPTLFISVCIIDSEEAKIIVLEKILKEIFPEIKVVYSAAIFNNPGRYHENFAIDLIFSRAEFIDDLHALISQNDKAHIISLSHKPEDAITALRKNLDGFLLLPLTREDVELTVSPIIAKIKVQKNEQPLRVEPQLPHTKLVGVPTMEGIEFINTEHIVRCEGLQKCTLIITTEKSDVISSYSIGKFRELLGGKGFFACHRSHHINLKFVKKYTREGFIFFTANCKPVPLARRRKYDFLNQINHL